MAQLEIVYRTQSTGHHSVLNVLL